MTILRVALLTLALAIPTGLMVSEAQADGYIGAGFGSDSELHGDIGAHFSTDDQSSSRRIIMGQRFGALALEASLFGSELRSDSALVGNEDASTLSLGVDLKYHLGLIAGLEAYGKFGLNKTWLRGGGDFAGRGQALGFGLQYTFDLPLTSISLWADYAVQSVALHDGARESLDGQIAMGNLGVSLGF